LPEFEQTLLPYFELVWERVGKTGSERSIVRIWFCHFSLPVLDFLCPENTSSESDVGMVREDKESIEFFVNGCIRTKNYQPLFSGLFSSKSCMNVTVLIR
jgi:hypothetical protein